MIYHNPVLLAECIKGLKINPEGTYIDVTFGGGGHSKSILNQLKGGKLYAFDQDVSANINGFNKSNFKLINANFRYLKNFLQLEGVTKIDGLLADLGVSSNQFDVPKRGFSIRFNGDLDMRMNVKSNFSAKDVVNDYTEEELANVFYKYGEFHNSRRIARKIKIARQISAINTTYELIDIVGDLAQKKHRNQFLARVFQSIRIEVNDEISSLKEMLLSAVDLLNIKGRLVVLSYHSLEDRLVKNFINKGNFIGEVEKDFYGNQIRVFKSISKKPIIPSKKEIIKNPRSRSAKLRIGEII